MLALSWPKGLNNLVRRFCELEDQLALPVSVDGEGCEYIQVYSHTIMSDIK